MATRVYFHTLRTSAVTVPAAGAEWEHVQAASAFYMGPVIGTDALQTLAYTPDAVDDVTDRDALHYQYVSDPLAAQTLAGNIKGQFQCSETANNDNLFLTFKLMSCARDGSSISNTLLAITRDTTTEFTTSLVNKNFPSTALTSTAIALGERLILEIGAGGNITTGAGGTIGHNASLRWGNAATSGDLPEDDTEAGTTFRPWVEFSQTILFEAALFPDTNMNIRRTRLQEW